MNNIESSNNVRIIGDVIVKNNFKVKNNITGK